MGPGCETRVAGPLGLGKRHKEYLNSPRRDNPNPHYLQDWEKTFLDHLKKYAPSAIPGPQEEEASLPDPESSEEMEPHPTEPPGPRSANVIPPLSRAEKLQELQALVNKMIEQPEGGQLAVKAPCALADFQCRITRQNMMYPPSEESEAAANVISDPCRPTSLCSTWRYIRTNALDPFGRKLTNGSFHPDAFESDAGSLWSKEGTRLWNEANNQATGNQALGGTYMSRMSLKNQLELLTETRFLRLELQEDSLQLFRYVLGLGIPGVLLTAVYMTLTIRAWLISRRQHRRRVQTRRQADDELLQQARAGQQMRLLTAEQCQRLDG